MKTDHIIDKIQKLLAKAESSRSTGNLEEAALFSAKVTELLTVHNLRMGDLDTKNESDVEGVAADDLGITRQFGRWTVNLLFLLCKYNFCKTVFHSSVKDIRFNRRGRPVKIKDNNYNVTLIGQPENIEVVSYLFSVLKSQFERISKAEWKVYLSSIRRQILDRGYSENSPIYKKPWAYTNVSNKAKWLTSFYLGAVNGVRLKLEENQQHAEAEYGSKINDLVLVKDAAVSAWLEENFPNIGTMKSRRKTVDDQAYQKGIATGRESSMARGLATGQSIATRFIG